MSDDEDRVREFTEFRQKRMNQRILTEPNQVRSVSRAGHAPTIRRAGREDQGADGTDRPMVLRRRRLHQLPRRPVQDAGVTREEMFEAFSVGLVAASIVIRTCGARVDFPTAWQGEAAAPPTHDHGWRRAARARIRDNREFPSPASGPPRGARLSGIPSMTTITVIRGDGIGPEIMDAPYVLDAMQLGLQYEFADAGMVALEKHGEPLPAATMDSIRLNRASPPSPTTTLVAAASARSTSSCASASTLYANVCPAKSFPTPSRGLPSGVDG